MTNAKRKQAGFTLLELMITVAIVAILSTIAYSAYTGQVMRTRRASAASCLQERAQFLERYYTTNMTYVGAPAPDACGTGVAGHYGTPAFAAGSPTATAYTLQIAPVAGSAQARNDTECATLTLSSAGVRGATGTASSNPQVCW